MGNVKQRQEDAAAIGFALAIGLPIITLLGCLLVAGWAMIVGVHDPHGFAFGWLSKRTQLQGGGYHYSVGSLPLKYFVGVFTVYIMYQLAELAAAVFYKFRKALSS